MNAQIKHPDKSGASGNPRPLSKTQLHQAGQVAVDLLRAFRDVVARLPESARGASGMSRHLGVARTTCQRLVGTLRETDVTASTLIEVPGVQGLRQLLDAIQQAHGESEEVHEARQQVAAFDRLIRDWVGSQTKLRERLEAQSNRYDPEKGISEAARQRLFEAAVSVTGRECDLLLSINIFRPKEGDADQLECAAAYGLIGNVVHSAGMPICHTMGRVHSASIASSGYTTLERETHAILPEFCSTPQPVLKTHPVEKDAILYVLDHERYEDDEVLDVVFASRMADPMIDPATGQYSLDAVWTLVNCPCRYQILDVYIHRDMERLFRPNVDAQLWNPKLNPPADYRWATRIPIHPQLQLLGEGLDRAACPAYPRHAELAQHLFGALHWQAGEFIGFRCEMAYPVWRSGVCMTFAPIQPRPTPAAEKQGGSS